jgi:hypothetical protein
MDWPLSACMEDLWRAAVHERSQSTHLLHVACCMLHVASTANVPVSTARFRTRHILKNAMLTKLTVQHLQGLRPLTLPRHDVQAALADEYLALQGLYVATFACRACLQRFKFWFLFARVMLTSGVVPSDSMKHPAGIYSALRPARLVTYSAVCL